MLGVATWQKVRLASVGLVLLACNNPGATGTASEKTSDAAPTTNVGGKSGTWASTPMSALYSGQFDAFAPPSATGGGGAGGSGGVLPLAAPYGTSTRCGDAIVGADEECDDGDGGSDACTSSCQTRDQAAVPAGANLAAERYLGFGRHPHAGTADGFATVYVEQRADQPHVGATLFNIWGQPQHYVDVSDGAEPVDEANPVVAALPGGAFAVAWSDFDGDGSDLGVALRKVANDGALGALGSANAQPQFSQLNPDMVWTGAELVVAWEDYADAANGPDLRYRTFDANLNPTSGEQTLAGSELPEAAVALAPFNGSWAAAYREGTADGRENIVVRVGEDAFRVGPFAGGPIDDRPALVPLDGTHLLVAFSMDPMVSGTTNVPRVRYAVLDIESQAAPSWQAVDSDGDVLQRDIQVSQSSPSAALAPDGAYIAWRSEARPGDAAGDQLWLKHLRWTPAATQPMNDEEPELLLPRTCDENVGDQRTPELAVVPLPPSGALATVWTDFGGSQSQGAQPDVVVQYAPLRVPTSAPPITLTEVWPDATGTTWPSNWSTNAAPPLSFTTQYGFGEFNAASAAGSGLAWINEHTARNVDLTTTLRFAHYVERAGLFARRSDGAPNSYVGALLSSRKSDTWSTYSVAPDPGTGLPVMTTLQSMPSPKGFYNAGVGVTTDYRVRFRVTTQADGSVFVGLKAWRLGASEPAAWTLSSVEAPSSYVGAQLGQTAGRFGLFADVPNAGGGVIDYDDFGAKFFEGGTSGDLDATAAVPLLLPRARATYRRCNAGDVSGGTTCTVADGCCDTSADCAAGLSCDAASAEGLGVGSGASTCVAAHCADHTKNASEVRADCGGPDCAACSCTSTTTLGSSGYCSSSCRCGIGEYPCIRDADCLPGLLCGTDAGEPFGSAYGVEACVPPHCLNRVLDADQGETLIDCGGDCGTNCAVCSATNGAAGHCRSYCQCGVGGGNCLNDDDCAPPLICGISLGPRYGLATGTSACIPTHCQNLKKDATLGETRIDYGGECNAPTGLSLAEAMVDFPPLLYRTVSYGRDVPDLMTLPTESPPTGTITTPVLKRANHFVLNVPTTSSISMTFNVGNVASGTPQVGITLVNYFGSVVKTVNVPKNANTVVSLGTLSGLYELDVVPTDDALTYSISMNPATSTLALKDGADMTGPVAPLYFFVPAETDTGFLLGNLDTSVPVHFYDPSGAEVTAVHVTDKVYAINTHGKPGVWKTTFATTSLRAHLVNLPDIFSFASNWVVTSKRIRTDMNYGTPPSAAVTWQYLRYDNRFVFHVATASSPTFTFAVEDSTVPTPAATVVHLLTLAGDELTGSPFSVAPQTTKSLNVGQLQPGDYELYVGTPPSTTRYLITQPPGVSMVSVDGFNVGSDWLAGYRDYFGVPAGTTTVRFAGPTTSTYKVYDASGAPVSGQPVAKGNGVYEIQNTTPGTWALNVSGKSTVRLLNVPLAFAYTSGTQAVPSPSPPYSCVSNSDCPSGQVCGADNGARFGHPATDDLCWPTSCASPPAGYCGSVLSPCGTCP
jgi:hypothetical protein